MTTDVPKFGSRVNWLEDLIFLNKTPTETVKPFQEAVKATKAEGKQDIANWDVEYSVLTDDDMQDVFEKADAFRSLFGRDREIRKLVLAMALRAINGIPVYSPEDFDKWKIDAPADRENKTPYDYKRALIGSWEPLLVDFFYDGYQRVVELRRAKVVGEIKKSPPTPDLESAGPSESESDSTRSSELEPEVSTPTS